MRSSVSQMELDRELLSPVTAFAVWCGPEAYRNDIAAEEGGAGISKAGPCPLLLRSA